MVIRLRVKEVAEQHKLNRYEIGRAAHLSNPTMDKFWLRPFETRVLLSTLSQVATAITELLREKGSTIVVTTHDLFEELPEEEEEASPEEKE